MITSHRERTYHIKPNTTSKGGLTFALALKPSTLIEIHQVVMRNKHNPACTKTPPPKMLKVRPDESSPNLLALILWRNSNRVNRNAITVFVIPD